MTQQREQYIEKAKSKLDMLDAELRKLEARARDAKSDIKIEVNKEIDDIKASKKAADDKLRELRSASDEAWEDLKSGAESAWRSLSSSIESATQRFE